MVRRKIKLIPRAQRTATPRKTWQQKKWPRVKALQRYLQQLGPGEEGRQLRADFAKRLKTTPSYLVHLGLGNRRASMELAIRIEQESRGYIRVEDMLPAADWDYLARRKMQRAAAADPLGMVNTALVTA